MAQQFSGQTGTPQLKTRISVVVFIKGASTPLALYVEKPKELYAQLQQMIKAPTATLFEVETSGPIRKVSFMQNSVAAAGLQVEQYT